MKHTLFMMTAIQNSLAIATECINSTLGSMHNILASIKESVFTLINDIQSHRLRFVSSCLQS